MEIIFKVISDYIIYLIPLLSVLYAFSIVNLPLTNYIFKNLSDRGFQTSKILGLVIFSYIYFTIVSLDSLIKADIFKLNSFQAILTSILVTVLINYLVIKYKFSTKFNKYYMEQFTSIKVLFKDEKIFFLLISFFYFLNSFEQSITYFIEQPLHYMIIEKLRNSESLPIADPAFAGELFNYYYFGQFICYTLILFLPYSFQYSYLLLLIAIPSLVSISFIQLLRDIVIFYFPSKIFKSQILVSQFIGFVIFFFFNSFTFTYELTKKIYEGTSPFSSFLNVEMPIKFAMVESFSNIIINKMILHGHFLSLMYSILAIRIIFYIYTKKLDFNVSNVYFIIFGFLLGLMLMTNAADFIIYLGLLLIIILLSQFNYFKDKKLVFIKKVILFLYIPFITILLWKMHINVPGGMLDIVRIRSTLVELLNAWGSYLALILIIIYVVSIKKYNVSKYHIPIVLLTYSFVILVFLEFFYLKDASSHTDWHRFNTYYKFSNQVLLFLTLSISILSVPFLNLANRFYKVFFCLIFVIFSTYIPYNIIYNMFNYRFTGISDVIENSILFKKYPEERKLYNFITGTNFNNKIFLTYNDHGYSEQHYTLMLSGRTSFLGYHSHELSWRGDENLIFRRIDIVNEIFLGDDLENTRKLLKINNIDFIIINKFARESVKNAEIYNYSGKKYPYPYRIQEEKLSKLTNIVLDEGDLKLLEVIKNF